MFKNLILYKITDHRIDTTNPMAMLAAFAFEPCALSQEKSIGWVPPRGHDHGPLMEVVVNHCILKAKIETKDVPSSVIDRKFAEKAKAIEAATGRKPGKKESREIKDDIRLELLPMAFTKESAVLVWIDLVNMTLAIDAASQARADEVVTLLVKSMDGLALGLVNTTVAPAFAMSSWLHSDEPPAGFSVDRECELKAQDESKAVVKYGKHPLDIDEVKAHIAAGKVATKLAMTWDARVSFVLTEGLQIKKIEFLDVVFESNTASQHADSFDADVAIATGELRKLIPDLIAALGGEPAPF